MSYTNISNPLDRLITSASSLILSDNATNQTLTGNLGDLTIATGDEFKIANPTITYLFSNSVTFPTISVSTGELYIQTVAGNSVNLLAGVDASKAASVIATSGNFNIGSAAKFTINSTKLTLAEAQLTHAPTSVAAFTMDLNDALIIKDNSSGTARTLVDVFWENIGTRTLFSARDNATTFFSVGTTAINAMSKLIVGVSGVTTFVWNGTELTTNGTLAWQFDTGGAIIGDAYTFQANNAAVAAISSTGITFGGTLDRLTAGALQIGGTTATSIVLKEDAITIGAGTTTDPTTTWVGATTSGVLFWDESADIFFFNDNVRIGATLNSGTLSVGAPQDNTKRVYVSANTGDTNMQGIFLSVTNNQSSSSITYQAYGAQTQANIGAVTGTRASAYGAYYAARMNNATAQVYTNGELVGGRLTVDTSGTRDGITYPSWKGLYITESIGSGYTNMTLTEAMGLDFLGLDISNASSTITTYYGIRFQAPTIDAGSSIGTFYNFFIPDQTNNITINTAAQLFYIEAQNGTAAAAGKWNMYWEGGDWNTGHFQVGAAHWWVTGGVTRFKTAVPTSATDYDLGVSATAVQPGTNGGLTLGANGQGFASLILKDTAAAFETTLQFTSTSIAADSTLTFNLGTASRTITLSGNPTLADWFDQDVKTTASPQFVGLTLTGDLSVQGNTTIGNATTDTVRFNAGGNAAAPTTNLIGVIVDYYGSSATRVLTTPNRWWSIVADDGNTYKIPLYT